MLLHKNFSSTQTLLQSVYRSMTYKEEITQVFVNKSTGGKNVANPYNGRLFSH